MGRYTVIKPFVRKYKQDNILLKVGQVIEIELRTEAQEALKKKLVVKGKVKIDNLDLRNDEQKKSKSRFDYSDEEKKQIQKLARKCGLRFEGAEVLLRSFLKGGTDFDQAIYLVRKQQGSLTAEELLAEFAQEMDQEEEIIQAGVYKIKEIFKFNMEQAIYFSRIIIQDKTDFEDREAVKTLVAKIKELIEIRSHTPEDAVKTYFALKAIAEEDAEDEAKEAAQSDDEDEELDDPNLASSENQTEIDPKIKSPKGFKIGDKVLAEYKDDIIPGVVVYVTKQGVCHVALEKDETASYRVFDDDLLALCDENKEAING